MKRIITLFVVTVLAISGFDVYSQVQSADTSIVQSLERMSGNAKVRLFQDARLTDRLSRRSVSAFVPSASSKDQGYVTLQGYRIQVFSDNNQRRSKDEAYQKANMIKGLNPELATYVTFTSPFWRLRVGNFRSFEEANLKMIELKNVFPQLREMRIVKDMIRLPRSSE